MLFRKIIFSQASSVIDIGQTRLVTSDDRLKLPEHLSPYLEDALQNDIDWSTSKSLYKSLFRYSKSIFFKTIAFQILGSSLSFSVPILIHEFITGLQNGTDIQILLIYAFSFGVVSAGQGLAIQHYFYHTLNFFQRSVNVVNKKIFSQALKLSSTAKQKYQVGDVVNFMSTDADTLGESAMTTIDLANAVVLLTGCSILLFYYLGWSAIVAIIVMAILVPLTQHLAKTFTKLEHQMMSYRDSRVTLMTQILNAIRVVKYFSWEKSVQKEVSDVRENEIRARLKFAKAEILWGLMYASISTVVLFFSLLTHYYRGQEINLALVLTCISIFSLMEDHFRGLSRFISRFTNAFVSADRITNFIKADTVESTNNILVQNSEVQSSIQIKNLNYGHLFKNLNLNIGSQQSIAIVGPVGSGKTTLLNLLLNEIKPDTGEIQIQSDKIAYVSQEAFIINTTLRENLLFGQNISEKELYRALDLACLLPDLSLFPKGIDTEIGEKGVNLSGGQKQRVSIARAILARTPVILLDDPLSAVDYETEKRLCEKLIFGEWKNKTRVVVTHRISQLKNFDQIIFLNDGRYESGTYDELIQKSEHFNRYLDIELNNQKNDLKVQETFTVNEISSIATESETDGRVTVDEDRALGSVKKDIYLSYIQKLGGDGQFQNFFIWLLFLSALAYVLSPLLQKVWLTQMSSRVEPFKLIVVYGLLGLLTLMVFGVNTYWWTYRGITAGRLFHDRMLASILKSKIRFFDSTPIGRILQRFSRDIESVDLYLQWSFDAAVHSLFNIVISFFLIVITLPISLFVLTPVLFLYYKLQNQYRRVAREIKRLDSLARSPRYAHFKETLQGLAVIRAFNNQKWFESEFLAKLNYSNEMYYTHYMVNRWFSSRLPLVGGGISVITTFGVVYATQNKVLSVGLAGLVTLYALEFWRHLNWGVRIFSDLESRMTSVERLNFYTELPSEIQYITESEFRKQQPAWPKSGSLEFKNVHLKYADHLPDVLRSVNFLIPSGQKAGLVGRTGSGKSTIFQAVYRFVDFYQGDILVDGLSIKTVPLEILRKNMAVIPQDPSLFMGTLRSNIDRYADNSDSDVWSVLEKVGLKKFVAGLPDQLNFKINENGLNLSQGQRQLICLARALLLKVKIIFLDEATASVDIETDALIQKVISQSLGDMTLITIAHRLATLKDYEQIIQLDQGRVIKGEIPNGASHL